MAAWGITPEMRAEYLLHWFEGYAEKNGVDALDNFDIEEIDAKEILEKIRTAYAVANEAAAKRPGQTGKGDEANNTGKPPPSGQDIANVPRDRGTPLGSIESAPGEPPTTYPADAADYFNLGPDLRFASLPGTMRRFGLDADDVVAEIAHDPEAQAMARRILDNEGIDGAVRVLRNLNVPGAEHTFLAQMIEQMYFDYAAAVEKTDPAKAASARDFARKLGREEALKHLKAGQYNSAARVLAPSPGITVDTIKSVLQDIYGRDATISPARWLEIENKAQKAEEDLALVAGLKQQQKALESKIKRLQKEKENGPRSRRSGGSQKGRSKLVALVKETQQQGADDARARLLARFGGPTALKSVLRIRHKADTVEGVSSISTNDQDFQAFLKTGKGLYRGQRDAFEALSRKVRDFFGERGQLSETDYDATFSADERYILDRSGHVE